MFSLTLVSTVTLYIMRLRASCLPTPEHQMYFMCYANIPPVPSTDITESGRLVAKVNKVTPKRSVQMTVKTLVSCSVIDAM